MGTRGPVPKRSESRQRRNEPAVKTVKADGADDVRIPPESREWHPAARRIWRAAKKSGQARFYEPSDWAILHSLMDDLTHYKDGSRRSGQMLQTIMSSLSSLLLTEGDRRRLQIELARPVAEESASIGAVEVAKWQGKLSAVS